MANLDRLYGDVRRLERQQRDADVDLRELKRFAARYQPLIEAMVEADKVNKALSAATREARKTRQNATRIHLTWWQASVATITAAVTISAAIFSIVSSLTP